MAAYLSRSPAPQSLGELIRPIGVVFGAALGLILVEPDLGTAISIVVMLAAVLVVAGTRFSTLAGAGAIGLGLIGAAIWLEPYRRERILSFLDPWQDPQGAGFQSVQAMIALGSGGFFGVGLGESVQKVYYLPEASTDMIFAIIGEELGLFGAFAVLAAFVVFGYAGFNVALRVPRSLREAPRGRDHRAHLRPGGGQRQRRHGPRAADRDPAAVRLLRRLEPGRPARLRRHPP